MIFVYGLTPPGSKRIVYVGLTANLAQRTQAHRLVGSLVVLQRCATREAAVVAERKWIKRCARDCALRNIHGNPRFGGVKETIGVRVPASVVSRLRAVCKRDGITVSAGLLRATEEWCAKWFAKMERAK